MATPLLEPREGVPELITSEVGLRAALDQLQLGHGPIAIDAERASGYRYSQRAYLIQIFRRAGGLHLIDPVAVGKSSLWAQMSEVFRDEEWIIHASTQDLPCLREVGLEPHHLFDTELGGRIAGCERVGLGPLAESLLELQLAKEHSAVDWSTRPLRSEWLTYAALDVDILVDLRDEVEALLRFENKLEWALADFAAILEAPPPAPRKDPWRRTSGMHKIRDRQTLAVIQELWQARDEFARTIDLSPGRVFNDEALITLALKKPNSLAEFDRVITRRGRSENPPIALWHSLMLEVLSRPESEYPDLRSPVTSLPPMKTWKEKNPLAYARLTHARAGVLALAEQFNLPAENLISPEFVRRICWQEPDLTLDNLERMEAIESDLSRLGARAWQIDLVGPVLLLAQLEREALVIVELESEVSESAPISE